MRGLTAKALQGLAAVVLLAGHAWGADSALYLRAASTAAAQLTPADLLLSPEPPAGETQRVVPRTPVHVSDTELIAAFRSDAKQLKALDAPPKSAVLFIGTEIMPMTNCAQVTVDVFRERSNARDKIATGTLKTTIPPMCAPGVPGCQQGALIQSTTVPVAAGPVPPR